MGNLKFDTQFSTIPEIEIKNRHDYIISVIRVPKFLLILSAYIGYFDKHCAQNSNTWPEV